VRRLTRRQRTAALLLAAVALCFLTLDLVGGGLRSSHDGARGTLGALYRGTDAVLGPARRFAEGVPSAASNTGTINRLRHQNARLRGELAARSADARTHDELAALQLAATRRNHRILPGRVVALGSADGFDWTATLDAGSSSGVQPGQSVTDGYALVGRVLHADASTSVVLLAADPDNGVGARDTRSGEVGLATGHGTDGFSFVPLSPKASVRPGDKLVTGPTGSTSFVPGLSVGTVTAVHPAKDGGTVAQVRAASRPGTLDLVGVILGVRHGKHGSHGGGSRAALSPNHAAAGG
jgi:rod shape-determining protein MreC